MSQSARWFLGVLLAGGGAITAHAQSFHGGIAAGSTKSNSACVGATTCDTSDVGGRAWVGVTNGQPVTLKHRF